VFKQSVKRSILTALVSVVVPVCGMQHISADDADKELDVNIERPETKMPEAAVVAEDAEVELWLDPVKQIL